MKLAQYISNATEFSKKHGFPLPVITRFLNGTRGLSAQTMAKIVAATNGEVTYEDLIAEMQERQAVRKKKNRKAVEAAPHGV